MSQKTRISVYTTCTNAIEDEFTLFEGMLQALRFCDEFVYVDGGSNDGTLDYMYEFAKKDSRIKVLYNKWDESLGMKMYGIQRNIALNHCTGDWCFLLDADEVYSEAIVSFLQFFPVELEKSTGVCFRVRHFYGKHNIYCKREPVLDYDYCDERVYGFMRKEIIVYVDKEDLPIKQDYLHLPYEVFHYTGVKSKEVYLRKINKIGKQLQQDWREVKDWDFTDIYEKNREFLKIGICSCVHPSIMRKRISYSKGASGFVEHCDIVKYYKIEIPRWLSNIGKLKEIKE